MPESRIEKSMQNVKWNTIFYFVMLIVSFFSRKTFLDTLGAEFMGLSGTMANILSMLSLAELGVGSAMSFHLYKPIHDGNRETINELISLYGWFYRIAGTVILVAAVIISAFFPLMLKDSTMPLLLAYVVFYSYLVSSLLGYFINYRQVLLSADQRQYVVSKYLQGAYVIKTIVQIGLCWWLCNCYVWIGMELIFSLLACVFLNYKIDRQYPWLHPFPREGRRLNRKYSTVLKSAKQVFIHQLKYHVTQNSDQILIFTYVSLTEVAYYGNYVLVFGKINNLFSALTGGIMASVGSVISDRNFHKSMEIFWEQQCIRYIFAGIVCVAMYFLVQPLFELWLGKEYILSNWVLLFFSVNAFLYITNSNVTTFLHCYGMYGDVWSAVAEIIIMLTVTLLVAPSHGIIGILLGKFVSILFILSIWKPYYLFHYGLKESFWLYARHVGLCLLLFAVSVVLVVLFTDVFPAEPGSSWGTFVVYALCVGAILASSYFGLMFFFTPGMRGFIRRVIAYYRH